MDGTLQIKLKSCGFLCVDVLFSVLMSVQNISVKSCNANTNAFQRASSLSCNAQEAAS